MNYKQAALEQLRSLPAQDGIFRRGLIYAVLSLGQTDEVEAVASAAINFIHAVEAADKARTYAELESAVTALVGAE